MHDPYSAPTCETTAMNSTTAPRSALALPAGTPAAARTALQLLQRLHMIQTVVQGRAQRLQGVFRLIRGRQQGPELTTGLLLAQVTEVQ